MKTTHLWKQRSQLMENGLFTIMWSKKWYWRNWNKPPLTTLKNVSIWKRWCCVSGGIGKHIVYHELLQNQTLNSDKYSSQLNWLKSAFNEKCPELANRQVVIFHEDNTRPHISLQNWQKLVQLRWNVLLHPLYFRKKIRALKLRFVLVKQK